MYRRYIDRALATRHRITDFFFALPPLQPASRLQKICEMAETAVVELETHPENPEECDFLLRGQITEYTAKMEIAKRFEF